MSVDAPRQLVLDAGPLIGYFDRGDRHHADATRGFNQLLASRTLLAVPLPIVFEVYKWLAYHVGITSARLALAVMRESFLVELLELNDLIELEAILDSMPRWSGSLEDATLAMIGLRRDVPVWTLNYRDLAAFPNLRFWTPA